MRRSTIVKLIFFLVIFISFAEHPVLAAKKKKKKNPPGQKVSLFKRGYEDVTTRNNYYFNANLQWKETVSTLLKSRKVNYDSILPVYFHDKANLSSYNTEWDNIIKKVGLVMQMHDYTRWKDNAYLLLGEAHFMKGEYKEALQTFQYISTTMKGPIGQEKLAVTNKERLAIMREMEKKRKKASKEKQKIIEFKIDLAKKESEERQEIAVEKAETAKKEAQKRADEKQKILKEKIKLKEKYLELKERGKSVEPTFTEYYQKNSKYAPKDTLALQQKSGAAPGTKPSAAAPVDYSKLRIQAYENDTAKIAAEDRGDDNPLTDSLGGKINKRSSDLSLWEKIKHKPSRPEAVVWLSKVLIQQGEGETAHALIQYGQALKKLTRSNKRDLQLIEAYYYLERQNYEMAQLPMENVVLLTKKNKNKAWYAYILAQIQERTDQYTASLGNYKKAGKYSNDYELSFYCQMNMARLYGLQGLGNSEKEVTSKLKKLVRGGKNKEFADQVYYSLAKIALRNQDTILAIEHLNTAVIQKTTDTKQKGLCYLLLSSISLEQDRYQEALNFAAGAVANLPANHPEAATAIKEQACLTKIAQMVSAVTYNDTLLLLSYMSEIELNQFMASKRKESDAAVKKNKRKQNWSAGSSSSNLLPFGNSPVITSAPAANGKWYFYNPELIGQGYNQFLNTWGTRPLADGWRRSQKPFFNEISGVLEAASKDSAFTSGAQVAAVNNTPLDAGIALNIPRTPEELELARTTIAASLYGIGFELRTTMNRPDKSIPFFNRLLSDFSGSSFEQPANYNLYLAFTALGNIPQAEIYQAALIRDDPGSIYSKAITNPPRYILSRESQLPPASSEEVYYASTYALFNQGKYTEVVSRKEYARENYSGGKLIPQFEFLGAMSQGYLQHIPELKNELSQIILKYPNTEVQQKAQEYLKYINQKLDGALTANTENGPVTLTIPDRSLNSGAPQTPYQTGDNNLYFMAYFPVRDAQLESIKEKLTFVGDENFGKDKYRTSNAYLDNDKTVLLAKRFKGEEEAGKYMEVIRNRATEIFGAANKAELFIISQTNFRIFFDSKDIDTYRMFYEYYFK